MGVDWCDQQEGDTSHLLHVCNDFLNPFGVGINTKWSSVGGQNDGFHTWAGYGWLSVRVPDHVCGHIGGGAFNTAGRLEPFGVVSPVLCRRQSECQEQQDSNGQTSHRVERTSWLSDEGELGSVMEGSGIYWLSAQVR